MVTLHAAIAALALSGVGQTVLLDFYSDSCGPCRAMNPTVQQLINAGYPVQRINVSQNPSLGAKYGVQRVPCFVMLVNGRVVDQQVGMTSRERLEQMCRSGIASASASRPATSGGRLLPLLGRSRDASPQPIPPSVSLPPVAATQPPPAIDPFAAAPAAQPPAAQQPPLPAKLPNVSDAALLAASVRLRIEDPDGRSCGSGTIIDARNGEALVLTCGHIFKDSQGKGRIVVDLFSAASSQPQQVEGRLVSWDVAHDVGLVAISPPGPVAAAHLAPPSYQITSGMPVVSVGCNNGDTPTVEHSQIAYINKYQGPSNIEVAGEPAQGRSGGGLFSSEGYVIGVCNCADPRDKEGIFAPLSLICAELERNDFAFIYKSPQGSLDVRPASGRDEGDSPIFAGTKIGTVPTGVADVATWNAPAQGRSPAMVMPATAVEPAVTLAPQERAALDEIRRRAKAGSEVVIIVRPRGNPDAKSEFIVLDHASPELIRQLSRTEQRQDRPAEAAVPAPLPNRRVLLEWAKPAGAP
jgi:thiol-disulfide isomerase/thioredoxin